MGVCTSVMAKELNIKLEQNEKKFKQLESYVLNDYHFAWNIIYMDIMGFYSEASNGKTFTFPSNVVFRTRIKLGKATKPLSKKSEIWLAKAILKKEYFWKSIMPPSSIYGFTSLRFMEKGDARYKAITELKDINDMLGPIDTMAEWRLWFYATRTDMGMTQLYSYKKVGKLHRIRFASVNSFTCVYHEYFNYYDDYGECVKTKKLKEYSVKGCSEILI
jgi:hypothetical protein